jgi:hypothetical protein
LASIDAFWNLAARESVPKRALRASIRRLGPAATSTTDPSAARQRGLILLAVVMLHVALLLALRAAMWTAPRTFSKDNSPLQITIIERRALPIQPEPPVPPPPIPHPQLLVHRSIPRADALQAVTITPHAAPVEGPPKALLYDNDGALHSPAPPMPSERDPFVRRSASSMLPGSDHLFAPDLHVREDGSPQKTVEAISALLFGGGRYDPCPMLETNVLNTDDPRLREQTEERLERACPGR